MTDYLISILTLAAIYGIFAASLNLTFGYTGVANLAHLAFASIGAYVFAIATSQFGWPFPLAVALALALVAAVAAAFTHLIKKISGDQLALVTLFFALVVSIILLSWQDLFGGPIVGSFVPIRFQTLTRGALGIPIKRPPFLGDNRALLVAAAAGLAFTEGVAARIARSPFGRVLAAIRDDEVAAQTLGKNTAAAKMKVFVLSSLLSALGGVLFALAVRFIDPTGTLYLNDLIFVLTALIIGGLGSRGGPILGVLVVFTIVESLRFVPQAILPPDELGPMRQIIYTGALLVMLLVRPRGWLGKIDLT